MPSIEIHGGRISYEILGNGAPLVLTPGGRFGMDFPGVRPLAEKLAEHYQVLLWDRPSTGASDVKFTGESESQMHADDLAALLKALDLSPAILVGGSAGSRLSLVTALRHPEVASTLVVWWMSGGVFGTMYLAMKYILPVIAAAAGRGMEAVTDLPMWNETVRRQPVQSGAVAGHGRGGVHCGPETVARAYILDPEAPGPGDQGAGSRFHHRAHSDLPRRQSGTNITPSSSSLELHRLIPGSVLTDPP